MSLKKALYTFYASSYKEIINKIRYSFNTLFSMLMFYIIFFALMKGLSAFGGSLPIQLGDSVQGIVVSYYAWTMMLSVYTTAAYLVQQNQQLGTLENLIVNSESLSFVLISENIVSILFFFIFSWLNLFVFSIIAKITIYVNFFTVLYIVMVGLLSILGLSLMMSGFSLLYKRVNSFMNIGQFILLGFLYLKDTPISRVCVPFYQAKLLLEKTFIHDIPLHGFTLSDHLYLILNSTFFLVIGVIFFNLCLRHAKVKGTLNYY